MMVSNVIALMILLTIFLAMFIASQYQEHERDMDIYSFTCAKLALALIPNKIPTNTTSSINNERSNFDFVATQVLARIDRLVFPQLFKIEYKEIQIPVTPLEDRLTNGIVDSIMIRIYFPPAPKQPSIPLSNDDQSLKPVLIWFHGGGWVLGSAAADHSICTKLAYHTNYVVVNVDYRLAPNFVFPTAANDAFEAVEWVIQHIDQYGGNPEQIIVGGESAGGNLAAGLISRVYSKNTTGYLHHPHLSHSPDLCTDLKLDLGTTPKSSFSVGRIVGGLLVYPPLDKITNTIQATKYDQTNGFLRLSTMEWFRVLYAGNHSNTFVDDEQQHFRNLHPINPTNSMKSIRQNPLFAPGQHTSESVLQVYPPTVFILAQYDILTHENERFIEKLQSYGRQVSVGLFTSTIHAFFGRPIVSAVGDQALMHACREVKKLV